MLYSAEHSPSEEEVRADKQDYIEELIGPEGWELLWNDEFNGKTLNKEKWNVEDWAATKNNELQYYSPSNVKVEDGLLKLYSLLERFKGRNYTSGAIHTKGRFDLLYGKVEMRAKLPSGRGLYPAFWMITDNEHKWLPEINIMEVLGQKPDEVWMVVHWLDQEGRLTSSSGSFTGPGFSEDFHTFSIEWTPDSIVWLIDGVEKFRTNEYVPSEPMYLYLNTAIGGDWPGPPDHTTGFPAVFEIDYIRVYKK